MKCEFSFSIFFLVRLKVMNSLFINYVGSLYDGYFLNFMLLFTLLSYMTNIVFLYMKLRYVLKRCSAIM